MQPVHTLQQLDALFVKSNDAPVLIFKHSTACPVSADAKDEVQEFAKTADANGLAIALIYVIEDRPVSNAIAQRTGVQHQSPQAILVRGEEVVWHASHSAITKTFLQQAVH
jgi:bacillithiol system protein YtxJ